ncbi:ABC-type amino acid transport substrate-binding protein [Bradyrhizobium sp. USDA 4509]
MLRRALTSIHYLKTPNGDIDMTSGGLRIVIGALTVAIGLAAGAVCARSTRTVINAGINPAYPPFEYKDPATTQLVGFDIDLLEAMAAKMDAKVNWIETSVPQYLPSILSRRLDVVAGSGAVRGTGDYRQSAAGEGDRPGSR